MSIEEDLSSPKKSAKKGTKKRKKDAEEVCSLLEEDILSMAGSERSLPSFTPFLTSEDDHLQHLVQSLKRDCPSLCRQENRESLIFGILKALS